MCRKICGIVFDKDGTLFDFQRSWVSWMQFVLAGLARGDAGIASGAGEQLGFDLAAGRFLAGSSFVAGTPESTLRILERAFPGRTLPDIVAVLQSATRQCPQVEAVPLRPLLAELAARGFVLGIATNDHAATARMHLADAGILERFAFLAGSDSGFGAKPDPEMLLAFCRTTGISPDNSVMVGDSPDDLRAGRAAGMTNVGVLTGTASRDTLSPLADIVLNTVGDLPRWLSDERATAAA